MNGLELTGQSRSHITVVPELDCALHVFAVAPFKNLCRAASDDGFAIAAVSSFRDFSRQLTLWNGKFNGERAMVDGHGIPIDVTPLSPAERVAAILLWSALPGASRHHWGTDVDLIDRRSLTPGYQVRLVPEEYAADGPFGPLVQWLEANAARFGFFRPYQGVRSAVRPEPWHFSFAPVAEGARLALDVGVLRHAIETAPLAGKAEVLRRIEELHARYVARIDWP